MKILYRQEEHSSLSPLGLRDCYFKTLSTNKDQHIVTHKLHHHNFYELHILACGYERYDVEGETIDLQQGQMLLLCPEVRHRIMFSHEQTKKYAICFIADTELPAHWFLQVVSHRILERISFVEKETIFCKESSQFLLGNAVAEIIISVLRLAGMRESQQKASQETHIALVMAKQYVADNIDFAPSVSDVAQYCGLSTKQLSRIFLADIEMTPGEYIKKQQIERSSYLLRTTRLTLQQISEQMHFSSVYYFSAFFKKFAGMTPSAYRKMCLLQ